ncbi:MAG: hypothetical protein ACM3JI_02765 [Anaerolineae bacterium]
MKKIRLLIYSASLLTLFYLLAVFCEKKTDGFTILGIASDRSYDPRWNVHSLSSSEKEIVEKALSQPYTYFSRGGQSFVFLSKDEQYVIKFFKQRAFTVPKWFNLVPIPFILDRYKQKKRFVRADKLRRDFTSYKIAFDELKKETGIVYVHLNKTSHLNKSLKIIDKIGIEHFLDLDHFDFVVQRKAELVYDRISRQMRQGDISGAKKTIASAFNLILSRCKKGYHDRDPNLRTNCGFIGDQPIKIDVGRLLKDEKMKKPEVYKQELLRISLPFKAWIEAYYPTLSPFLNQEIEKITSA